MGFQFHFSLREMAGIFAFVLPGFAVDSLMVPDYLLSHHLTARTLVHPLGYFAVEGD
jgi:hypothetical protein